MGNEAITSESLPDPSPSAPKRAKRPTTKPKSAVVTADSSATVAETAVSVPAKPAKPKAISPKKPVAEKKPAAVKTTTAKKPATPKKPKAAKPIRSALSGKNGHIEITRHDIAVRAYLVWEKRNHYGLPGDETSDWIEAERQLREEA